MHHDARVWSAIEQSIPGRAAAAASRAIDRSMGGSRAVAWWHRATEAWTTLPPRQRMQAIGLTAIAASATHVALQWSRPPVGQWWLILPGMAAVFGLMALAASRSGGRAGRQRR